MTQDEIISRAGQAGMKIYKGGTVKVGDGVVKTKSVISTDLNELERFAALVAKPWIETNKALAKEIIELKKQAEQEPVAYVYEKDVAGIGMRKDVAFTKHVEVGTDLYAAQQPVQQAEQEPVKLEHKTDGSPCWCNPELNYKDPKTGAEVWVHKEPQ